MVSVTLTEPVHGECGMTELGHGECGTERARAW